MCFSLKKTSKYSLFSLKICSGKKNFFYKRALDRSALLELAPGVKFQNCSSARAELRDSTVSQLVYMPNLRKIEKTVRGKTVTYTHTET